MGTVSKPQIPGMQPIICTEPMELVHVDYVGMEVMVSTQEKLVVKNVLVIVGSLYPVCSSLCYPESDSEDHSLGTPQ